MRNGILQLQFPIKGIYSEIIASDVIRDEISDFSLYLEIIDHW
jgi:hypothetical protein